MGIEHLAAVLDCSRKGGSCLVVLLVVASYSDQHGEWVADQATLQRRTHLGRRRVQQVLDELVAAGDLAVIPGDGRGRRSTYRLTIGPERAKQIAPFLPPFLPLSSHTLLSPLIPQKSRKHLEQAGTLGAVGGLAYLTALDLDLPDLGRLDEYVDLVKERSVRRDLIADAQRTLLAAAATARPVHELLADLRDSADRLLGRAARVCWEGAGDGVAIDRRRGEGSAARRPIGGAYSPSTVHTLLLRRVLSFDSA